MDPEILEPKKSKHWARIARRYESDEVFSLLVDKIQHAMNETGLNAADVRAAANFLEKQ